MRDIGRAEGDGSVMFGDNVAIGAHGHADVRISVASTYMALDMSMSISTLDCE
jgi:hypothetical protein